MKDWELYIERAVRLSLMEKDSSSTDIRYWVTPLLREEIFGKLEDKERISYHKIAVLSIRIFFLKLTVPYQVLN